jgi:hypothetical protein
MPYVDPQSVHNPATGTVAPATWGDTVRDDLEYLIDPPACSVFNSTTQSTTTSTWTTLTADSENFDNNAMHSTVSNTSRITIQTAGRYLFFARNDWASNTAGSRVMRYKINGTDPGATLQQLMAIPATTTGINTQLAATWTLVLAAADYVEVEAWQNTGGNLQLVLREFGATFFTR